MTHLPGVLSIIASVAGRKAALAIAAKHGGAELRIPLDPPKDHWLCAYIGWKATQRVAVKIVQKQGAVTSIPFAPIDLPEDARFNVSGLNLISSVIGTSAALSLAENFSGLRLYIPKNPLGNARIIDAVGMSCARNLCEAFGQTVLYIPRKEVIIFRAMQMAKEGLTRVEIADRLKIGERQVYRYLKDREENANV